MIYTNTDELTWNNWTKHREGTREKITEISTAKQNKKQKQNKATEKNKIRTQKQNKKLPQTKQETTNWKRGNST